MKEDAKVESNANRSKIIFALVAAILFGLVGFFGGMKYQQSKIRSFAFGGDGNRQFGMRLNGQSNLRSSGFSPIDGEIISKDDKSITVKLQDGSTKIALFSDSTSITKGETKTKEDLNSGEKVLIIGETNEDGSITARNISLGDAMRFGSTPRQ